MFEWNSVEWCISAALKFKFILIDSLLIAFKRKISSFPNKKTTRYKILAWIPRNILGICQDLLPIWTPRTEHVTVEEMVKVLLYAFAAKHLECWASWTDENDTFIILADPGVHPNFVLVGHKRHRISPCLFIKLLSVNIQRNLYQCLRM